MPSDNRSAQRWGNTAVAGTAIAAGGAAAMLHGSEQAGAARRRIATHTADLTGSRAGLDDAQRNLDQYREGLKVNRASIGVVESKRNRGSMPSAAERKAAEQPYKRSIAHAKGRITTHEREITRQGLKNAGAVRVKRIGSGVLGAGATLGTLGAVMAERKRRGVPKAAKPPAPKTQPVDRPLKDYRSMVSQGGLLRDEQGKPKGISPSAGRDWLKANKDRA